MNYVLTLKHLENAFYSSGLAKYSDQDFSNAGFEPMYRSRIATIGQHEEMHVQALNATLGSRAVQPCTYVFPFTDPTSFVTLGQVIGGACISAYIGAIQYIQSNDYVLVAASILSTEGRHTAFLATSQNTTAWSGPFDIPLDLNEAYTLAVNFIQSCPPNNPSIPVQTFSQLDAGIGDSGQTIALTYNITDSPGVNNSTFLWGHFLNGLTEQVEPVNNFNRSIRIPDSVMGTVYLVLSQNESVANDQTIVAGPAVLIFEAESDGGDVDERRSVVRKY
ncbi:ferritin-like domain-containing protein [Crassisporium funariophilum]|nr:ferritin-like domain-containing protein [Crassisporium funariophilum]